MTVATVRRHVAPEPAVTPAAGIARPIGSTFFTPVPIAHETQARLCVVVDTEAEFDWLGPFTREAVAVSAVQEIWRLHEVLRARGIRPTYVVDYPVATAPAAFERLAAMARDGSCEIGAHLHPWVTPPHAETLSLRNSFACNLGLPLETEKMRHVRDAIVQNLAVEPRSYKAGRWGFGRTTAEAVEALGFDVDLSVNAYADFSSEAGPPFVGLVAPAWFGRHRRVLELPTTTGFAGVARRAGPTLHGLASRPWPRRFRAVGLLARAGLVNKILLCPEICPSREMQALTKALHDDGLRVFTMSLHSTSLKPGCTPYVASAQDRERLLDQVKRYCDYFLERLGGRPSTPSELFDDLARRP